MFTLNINLIEFSMFSILWYNFWYKVTVGLRGPLGTDKLKKSSVYIWLNELNMDIISYSRTEWYAYRHVFTINVPEIYTRNYSYTE